MAEKKDKKKSKKENQAKDSLKVFSKIKVVHESK